MTSPRSALERYLSMRQGLGYKYHHQTRRLTDFVTFMEKRKATTITTKLAIRTLLGWYRDGMDVEQQLPVLSTYLGHACVRDTYWYLSACPELMQEAARRLDRRWEARP
jgi:hypothetical protein